VTPSCTLSVTPRTFENRLETWSSWEIERLNVSPRLNVQPSEVLSGVRPSVDVQLVFPDSPERD
jgi:hypothetical protein